MIDIGTPRPWKTYSDTAVGTDAPKYATKEAVMIYADEDCETHPIADCSANHTCRADWECAENAALIVRAVNNHDDLLTALATAQNALACARHLVGKYVPEHHWVDKLDAEIDAVKAALAKGSDDE